MAILLEMNKAKIMKDVVDALSIAHNEVHIKIEPEGFRAQTQGSGSFILTDIFLNKECFSRFDVTETIVLHVDLVSFGSFIKLATNNDVLSISYDKENAQLNLLLQSEDIIKKSSLRLLGDDDFLDANQENREYRFLEILNKKFHSNAKFRASFLIEAIKVASFGEGQVDISHDENGIYFSVTSENQSRTSEANIVYTEENVKDKEIFSGISKNKGGVEITIPKIHEASYDLESLKSIPKTIKSGEEISFSMMHMGPLRIVSEVEDGNGHIAIALSPIIIRQVGN